MTKLTSLKISISGVRGIVGQTLTPQLVASFAAAFGSYAGRGPILVGSDTRPSRAMVTQAVFAGLLGTGAEAIDLGVVPVPSLQVRVKALKAFGGIAVTASHNPIEWNAMKFIGPGGLYLNPYQAEELLDIYHQGEFRRVQEEEIQRPRVDVDPFKTHLDAILNYVDVERIRAAGLKVAVDCVNGAACEATPRLLDALGCRWIAINRSGDEPFPHDPEPLAEHLTELVALAKQEKVDIAFAQDADADRLAVVCPLGGAIGEEYTLVLAARQVLKKKKAPLVVNLSTSRLIEDVARGSGVPVFRTRVGEIHVTEQVLARNGALGGEGNGGVILPEIHPCRDSFGGMAVILELLATERKPLREIVASMPRYAMIKEKTACPSDRVFAALKRVGERFEEGALTDRMDGVRLSWDDRWLQVRPSNTEPILRVFAEAKTRGEARNLIDGAMEEIRRAASGPDGPGPRP